MARFASLTLLLFVSFAIALPAADWTTFRGPHGAGEAIDLPPGTGPLVFETGWKKSLGSGYSGVSIAGDVLVTAFAEGDTDFVVALDAATGEEHWRYSLAPTYPGHDGSHDGPISTPAIADGRVFALGPWGEFAAVELETGAEIWTVHLAEDLGSEKPHYGFGSSPAVLGDTVVLQVGGEEGSVAGFDVATGRLRWRAVEDEVAAQSPVAAELAGRQQVVALGLKNLTGLDPTDGSVLWQIEHGADEGGAMGAYTASPLPLGEDRLLVKLDDQKSGIVRVTANQDGTMTAAIEATSTGMTKSYSPPSRSGEHVFGYTARFLSAVDSNTGELLWRSRDPGDGFPISVGGQLVVLTKKGEVTLGPSSPAGWRESSRLELFDDLAWTPPSYSDGSLYLRSLGEIARVELVREARPQRAETHRQPIPEALRALAAKLRDSDDPAALVDTFLEGKSLPLIDGEQVVFLWRGDAQDVAIGGDMIGMRREEPMRNLDGTDLWWWSTELDRQARVSYLYFVDYLPTTDPAHGRTTASSILGPDMNWNRGEALDMSWLAMPDWPGHKIQTAESGSRPAGRLDTFELTVQPPAPNEGEAPEPVDLSLPVWLPPGYDESGERYPVIYVTERQARERGGWVETLDRVTGDSMKPTITIFLEMRIRGGRDILVEQIVPAIDQRYRTLADREHRAVVGMGWPGAGAAVTAFSNPKLFGVLGVQSFFALESPTDGFAEALGDHDAASLPMRIYLEWGRWDLVSPHEEMNFRASSKEAWDLLRERGWEPVGGEVWDSTDWGSWKNRTDLMLQALFPIDANPVGIGAWGTSGD